LYLKRPYLWLRTLAIGTEPWGKSHSVPVPGIAMSLFDSQLAWAEPEGGHKRMCCSGNNGGIKTK